MRWTVGQVARAAGISTRTLRHYDALNLLVPDRDPDNGYRIYRRPHLLRLQRILLLRSLGLSLTAITDVLECKVEDTAALEAHLAQVDAERSRLDRLAQTLRRTLAELSGAPLIDIHALFAGFEQQRERLEHRLVARYGDTARQHFEQAAAITEDWDREDMEAAAEEGQALLSALSALRSAGIAPDDDRVAPLITLHHESVRAFWDASTEAYRQLAHLLVEDDTQRQLVDVVAPGLAPWLRDAILAHTGTDLDPTER